MRNLVLRVALMLCLTSVLSACSDLDFITEDDYLKNEYSKNWIKKYGLIDPGQEWNMATQVTAAVDPASFGPDATVCVYSEDPYYGGCLIARITTPGEYPLDVVKGCKRVYVRVYSAGVDGCQSAYFPVADGRVDIGASSRAGAPVMTAAASRADETPSPYNWIVTCEDLGGGGDTDFNDVVVGLTYVEGEGTLTVTALAAGGVFKAEVYYKTQKLFEIHEAFNLGGYANGSYPMYNTQSWRGPGESVDIPVSSFSAATDLGDISFKVFRAGEDAKDGNYITKPEKGSAPQMLCLPGNWEWPSEQTDIKGVFPRFIKWSKDENANLDWYQTFDDTRVVKRNWYPAVPNTPDPTVVYQTGATEILDTGNAGGRDYTYFIPANLPVDAPLMVVFHGARGHHGNKQVIDPAVIRNHEEKCIVVWVEGTTQHMPGIGGDANGWVADPVGNPSGFQTDLNYVKAVVADLQTKTNAETSRRYSVDPKRIYACGFSNGGMMTYAMAAGASDYFAAFAAISGFPVNEFHLRTNGARPVPFLHIHGKNDGTVRYGWFASDISGTHRSVVADQMAMRNGCVYNPDKTIGSNYEMYTYSAGEGGFPYVVYEVTGMGHDDKNTNIGGTSNTALMWDFLRRYKLDDACDPTLKWRFNIESLGSGILNHGWTSSDGTNLYFARKDSPEETNYVGDKTTIGANVYRSIQLGPGNYYLLIETQQARTADLCVAMRSQSGSAPVFNIKAAQNGGAVRVPFTLSAYDEFEMAIHKPDGAGTFTKFEIHSGDDTAQNWSAGDYAFYDQADSNGLIAIPQTQYPSLSGSGSVYVTPDDCGDSDPNTNIYTTSATNSTAFKILDVDVTGCDYILLDLMETAGPGWRIGFGGFPGEIGNVSRYVYNIPSGTTTLSEIVVIQWDTVNSEVTSTTLKVKGLYKHKAN